MEFKNNTYKVIDYIKIPFKADSLMTLSIIFFKVLSALIPSFQVLAISKFTNKAIDIFKDGNIKRIYPNLILIALLVALSFLCSTLISLSKLKLSIKVNEKITLSLTKKRSSLSYKHVENNSTWELISRVCNDAPEKILNGFNNLFDIMEYLLKIVSLVLIIAFHIWWIGIVVILIILPLFLIASKNGKVTYEAFEEVQKYKRKAEYLKDILSSRESEDERALFNYSEEIDKFWFEEYETARQIEFNADKKIFIKTKIVSMTTALLSMLIALVLLIPIKDNKMSAGMYMSLVTASFNLVKHMSWELAMVMQEYTKNKLYLTDLTKFSYLEELPSSYELKDNKILNTTLYNIEFKNVSFSYPGSHNKILSNLSMKLENNKQYAFVGKNGAGKTTITKLLTGLYDNYEGEIFINNKNIRLYSQSELKAYFSIVYQDFAKYALSIKDNIILGKMGQSLKEYNEKSLLNTVLQNVELLDFINTLPNGINTNLGKLTKADVDLSSGQWQRIAIARSLISSSPVCILDEPTASLDPITESKLYCLYHKASKEKLTMLITHRLGAARIADEILVLDNGTIVERGSHDYLISKNGIYSKMFEAQRSWYNE